MSGAPEDRAETLRRELEIAVSRGELETAVSRGIRKAEAELGIKHRDGVSWLDAPPPRRWHRCKPQSTGPAGPGGYVERCACGAIRMPTFTDPNPPWAERNSRRRRRNRVR